MGGLPMNRRHGRAHFLWRVVTIAVAANAAAIASEIAFGELGTEPFVAQFAILAVLLVSIVMISLLTVKRLHDLNRSLGHLFRLAFPAYNIYLVYILFCRKGTEGDNRYGGDPHFGYGSQNDNSKQGDRSGLASELPQRGGPQGLSGS